MLFKTRSSSDRTGGADVVSQEEQREKDLRRFPLSHAFPAAGLLSLVRMEGRERDGEPTPCCPDQ